MSYHPLIFNLDTPLHPHTPRSAAHIALHVPATWTAQDKTVLEDLIQSALRANQERSELEQAVPPTPRTNGVLANMSCEVKELVVKRLVGALESQICPEDLARLPEAFIAKFVRILCLCAGIMLAGVSLFESINSVKDPLSLILQLYLSVFGVLLIVLEWHQLPCGAFVRQQIKVWWRILDTSLGKVGVPWKGCFWTVACRVCFIYSFPAYLFLSGNGAS
eukprot:Gregarina_sp_Poly_1__3400@NODE_1986_length_2937_cov_844_697213_g1280_i0_p3_GENE_NODE_1986_length_2937_cov_844_697213_g1280_i0NODE_1986_length_2937_cov_844_697213_g1280_i0_p3_ORF_typecomplete_len220_score18_06COPI_assoc/PF08507_10/1e06DUF2107/PF09880_9/0_12_NODE_1986_length_2937_cov_844_697213_g1280_i07171376